MASPNFNNVGYFVPTTNVWDQGRIFDIDVNSVEFKQLLVRLYQNINIISLALNMKDTGYYMPNNPFVNGQQFFAAPGDPDQKNFRQVFRLLVNFGALPNATTKSVAHGLTITSTFSFTRIYGCASDQSGMTYIQLPYASPTLANNIELNVDSTNVNIITGSDRTNFTVCYVILEYLQS